jgi:hypothetical protein
MEWPQMFDDMDFRERAEVWFMRGVWLLSWPIRIAFVLLLAWLDSY